MFVLSMLLSHPGREFVSVWLTSAEARSRRAGLTSLVKFSSHILETSGAGELRTHQEGEVECHGEQINASGGSTRVSLLDDASLVEVRCSQKQTGDSTHRLTTMALVEPVHDKRGDPIQEECNLCILGAGYGGIGALVAASENLKAGDKVIIIDRTRGWGGHWIEQYSFLRLHQPYRHFSVGRFGWKLKQSRDYLATKREVLSHMEDIANEIGKKLKLVCLFAHEFDSYEEGGMDGSPNVLVRAHSIDYGRSVLIQAQKFIRATGFDVKIKQPVAFTSKSIQSVSVRDPMLCDPEIRYAGKPIYILGSGKTAMDLVCMLSKNNPASNLNITLIAGRGGCFGVRDRLFATKAKRWFGGHLVTDVFYDYSKDWDGENQADCLAHLERKGIIDSPISDPENWVWGVLSLGEIQTVKETVSEVIKGHVSDIVDDSQGNPVMHLRSGKMIPVEKESIIVNCTDHLVAPPKEKLLSPLGCVLYPQVALVFPATTNYYLSTVFLRGDLPKVADKLYRSRIGGAEPKNVHAVHSALAFLANLELLLPHLPLSVLLNDTSNLNKWYPLHRQALSFARLLLRRRRILSHAEELKLETYGE